MDSSEHEQSELAAQEEAAEYAALESDEKAHMGRIGPNGKLCVNELTLTLSFPDAVSDRIRECYRNTQGIEAKTDQAIAEVLRDHVLRHLFAYEAELASQQAKVKTRQRHDGEMDDLLGAITASTNGVCDG